jgi:hypothetical protein
VSNRGGGHANVVGVDSSCQWGTCHGFMYVPHSPSTLAFYCWTFWGSLARLHVCKEARSVVLGMLDAQVLWILPTTTHAPSLPWRPVGELLCPSMLNLTYSFIGTCPISKMQLLDCLHIGTLLLTHNVFPHAWVQSMVPILEDAPTL